jgi:hypothetical protein
LPRLAHVAVAQRRQGIRSDLLGVTSDGWRT